jgi:hypothetical protein
VDRWITANVSSCIDFYGIDKLINTEVAIITIAVINYWFSNAQFSFK